jgi:hypothetical protein
MTAGEKVRRARADTGPGALDEQLDASTRSVGALRADG